MKIKKGDKVQIIAGKYKGKTGTVQQVFPKENRVVVDGVNKLYKHARSQKRGETGQKIDFFAPLHASNVMLVSEKSNSPTRIGMRVLEDGKKVRIDKKNDVVIE